MMTFNAALKIYLEGLSIRSIASNKVYDIRGLKIEQASKKEQFSFWIVGK